MKTGLDFENIQNISFLGPRGSNTECACEYFVNKYDINASFIMQKTIEQVLEYVEKTPDTLAVLPVEDTTEGVIIETFDGLIKFKNPNIRILSEVVMPTEYCLLARTTEFYSIKSGIIAPPQVCEKCSKFIAEEFPYGIELIDASSTEEGAKNLASCNLTYASIGNKKLAEIYNLNVLRENINNDKSNCTRFVLIGESEVDFAKGMSTSLAFSTENKPGALLDVLQVFRDNKINLTYISSRPSREKFGQYIFYVTFDGTSNKVQVLKTIEMLKKGTSFLRFLGNYEKHFSR